MPGYNPETILEEQFESQRQQIQKHFQFQWDEVNRQARSGIFKSQKEYEQTLHELHVQMQQANSEFDQKSEQAAGQLKMVSDLAEQGFIKDPDEVKWRMVLGPEAERGMFPEQRDPRLEHRDILAEENRLFQTVGSFAIGSDGKLYQAEVNKSGDYTDQPDRSKPASQQEVALFMASADALAQLEQRKLGLVQSMADQGVPNPNRLQDLMISREKEGFFRKLGKGMVGYSYPGLARKAYRKIKSEFGIEPTGTFAQKVQQDVAPSLKQQPRTTKPQTGKKLTKKIAMQYLMQHGNRQDAMAAARVDGYTE